MHHNRTLSLFFTVALAVAGAQTPLNDTAKLLAEVIRVNTSNPPGNEAKLAA